MVANILMDELFYLSTSTVKIRLVYCIQTQICSSIRYIADQTFIIVNCKQQTCAYFYPRIIVAFFLVHSADFHQKYSQPHKQIL